MPRAKHRGVPDLGQRIAQFMHDQNLSVSELSARSEISQSYLSRLVAGDVTNPTIEFVLRIAHALGMTVSELLGEESQPQIPLRRQLDYDARLSELQRQVDELRTNLEQLQGEQE